MPEQLRTGPATTLTVLADAPEAFVVEAAYAGDGSRPPAHLHPAQDERFEVLAGTLCAVLDGEERTLGHGDTLDVPRGTAHTMWAPEPARVRWETRPGGRTAAFFRALAAPEPDYPALLREYADVFRLAG